MSESDTLQRLHKALLNLNKRAERAANEILVSNFVDSEPLFDLLATPNNQVIYGRRGTGKTHALKYLENRVKDKGDSAVYLDLRLIGSNTSIYSDGTRSLSDRASTLIIDVLNALFDEFYKIAVIAVDQAPSPAQVTVRLDDLANAISSIRISGDVEQEQKTASARSQENRISAKLLGSLTTLSGELSVSNSGKLDDRSSLRTKRSGSEAVYIDFANVGASITGLTGVLGSNRVWLLIDEWSEIPIDLQPYLADLLRRTILPVSSITVKIASIEHRSRFILTQGQGQYVGLELGADISADLNLDDFLVFDNDQEKAVEFFKNLIFKHYQSEEPTLAASEIQSPDQLVRVTFTQSPVFTEFVRAVEGVRRDALNLIAKVVTKSYGRKIAMSDVRAAARDWYHQDKASSILSNPGLHAVLEYIVDSVIGERRARAFLFPTASRDAAIEQLFDARLLHILKKNVSSRDDPGVRYDVYKIDYGCYVELATTTWMPRGLFGDEAWDSLVKAHGIEDPEVPWDDYRSIRRAILRPENIPKPA
jgi:hypothetical protein